MTTWIKANISFSPIAHHVTLFLALTLGSLPGFFSGSLWSRNYIGLLGLIPITIGLSSLLNQQKDTSMEAEAETQLNRDAIATFLFPQTYNVAAITLANGRVKLI